MKDTDSIENKIFTDLIKLRIKFIKNQNTDLFTSAWVEDEIPSGQSFSISAAKPRFLKRLYYLLIDDNFWYALHKDRFENQKNDTKEVALADPLIEDARKQIVVLIFLINGINVDGYSDAQLESIVGNILANFVTFGNTFVSSFDGVSFKSRSLEKRSITKQTDEVMHLIDLSKEYIEAMSIIWKFNQIEDSEDMDDFDVKYFSLSGLHKIIGGKYQSVRNLISLHNKDDNNSPLKTDEVDESCLHYFNFKSNAVPQKGKKITAFNTKDIAELLIENGFITYLSNNIISVYADHAMHIIAMQNTDKKSKLAVEKWVGTSTDDDEKIKVLGMNEYTRDVLFSGKDDSAFPLIKGFNFFKGDDPIYDFIDDLKQYKHIITIDSEFLKIKNQIMEKGFNKFFKENKFNPRRSIPFKDVFKNNKAEFKEVLSLVSKIENSINGLEHLIILARTSDDLSSILSLASIAKNLKNERVEQSPILVSCILSYPLEFEEQVKRRDKPIIEELDSYLDSVIHFDRNILLENIEDRDISSIEANMSGHGSDEYSQKMERLINENIFNIIMTIISFHEHFTSDRLADVTGGFEKYKEYIQGMVRAIIFTFDEDEAVDEIKNFYTTRIEHQVDRGAKSFVRKLIICSYKDRGEFQKQEDFDKAEIMLHNIFPINHSDHIVYIKRGLLSADYEVNVIEASG
tara:strand:- start:53 stop:2113 length:2061 start_codon:yes stop_codon:yes gene_type:complete